jgi:hypothetical protein
MCSANATSQEHVPPKCFFPSRNEIGQDLRRNLITVASCTEHNSKKSKDDEFLRAVILLTSVNTNEIAQHQFLGKFLRGASRNRQDYSSYFMDQGTFAAGTQRALKIDRNRFDRCIDYLIRALFFHRFQTKWLLPVVVTSPNIYSEIAEDRVVPHLLTKQAIELSRMFLSQEDVLGENPEIFKYKMRYDQDTSMFAFAGIFYDFFEFFSVSSQIIADEIAVSKT